MLLKLEVNRLRRFLYDRWLYRLRRFLPPLNILVAGPTGFAGSITPSVGLTGYFGFAPVTGYTPLGPRVAGLLYQDCSASPLKRPPDAKQRAVLKRLSGGRFRIAVSMNPERAAGCEATRGPMGEARRAGQSGAQTNGIGFAAVIKPTS